MKNIWYYRFLGVVVFWVVSVNLQAQSDSLLQSSDMNLQVQSNDLLLNSDLKKKGFRLALDVPRDATENNASMVALKRSELKMILPDEQFRSYKVSRNCFVASFPLLTLGTACLATSFAIFGASLMGAHYMPMAAIPLGLSVPFLVPGIILMVHSAKRIDKIADNYNKQRQSSYFQNGLQLNLGLVDNGIGVKLRF